MVPNQSHSDQYDSQASQINTGGQQVIVSFPSAFFTRGQPQNGNLSNYMSQEEPTVNIVPIQSAASLNNYPNQ